MCSAAQLHGVHGSRGDPGGATTVVDEAPLPEANDAKEDADNADDETGSAEQGLEEVPAVVLNPEQPEGLVDLLPDFLADLSRTPPDFLVDLVLQLTTRPPQLQLPPVDTVRPRRSVPKDHDDRVTRAAHRPAHSTSRPAAQSSAPRPPTWSSALRPGEWHPTLAAQTGLTVDGVCLAKTGLAKLQRVPNRCRRRGLRGWTACWYLTAACISSASHAGPVGVAGQPRYSDLAAGGDQPEATNRNGGAAGR